MKNETNSIKMRDIDMKIVYLEVTYSVATVDVKIMKVH